MIDSRKYRRKYKRFRPGSDIRRGVQEILTLSLSKNDLIEIVVSGAKSLRKAVAIGETLEIKS